MLKPTTKNSQNAIPASVSAQRYLRLISVFIQFFNIKYEVTILASLLRKIKIFEAIKLLKFTAIYASVF